MLPVACSHYTACQPVGGKINFVPSLSLFSANFGKLRLSDQVNSSLGMENNGELYGFSVVKVKLVDSLI